MLFSSEHNDHIIYDPQRDENSNIIKLTNKVIGLCLNEKHYDLVLNFKQFMFGSNHNFCIKCMKYYCSKA